MEELGSVDESRPQNRFNDAKCDVNGRLWAGTMSTDPSMSNLFTWSEGILQ